MALQYSVNNIPATGAMAIFNLKTWLKAQGWTVTSSSDGTTYNSSGDQITTGASGAGGMANNNAWFVAQMPLVNGVNRQYCFQRGTTNQVWRIKYSYSSGFTGGSPGSTQTPSAADEQVLQGAGTNAAPTFVTVLDADGGYVQHIAADSASPYGWWMIAYRYQTGTSFPTQNGNAVMFFVDPLQSGSYPTGDVDPYVMCFSKGTNAFESNGSGLYIHTALNAQPSAPLCWIAKGLSNQGFVSTPIVTHRFESGNIVPGGGLVQNPITGYDDLFPAQYGRSFGQTSPSGYKGISTLFKVLSVIRPNYGITMTVSTARDKMIFGLLALDWNGTIPRV